ncbi:MAG: ATP-binding protein [Acidobacteriota bacterium]
MKRYLHEQIIKDLKKKMVFITGPRQVGKTFLSKQIMNEYEHAQYLNFDDINGRNIINHHNWKQNADLLVFDEIHKMKGWKNYLKGVYDTKNTEQSILVTGSARLDMIRKSGDSMAGRYLHLRLNPLSVKEISDSGSAYSNLDKLNQLGPFPEPFLSGSEIEASRWRNQYFTNIIREDILDFSRINEIHTMKLLLQMLRERVGSPLSVNSLAEDLQVSPTTVQKYIQILENLYIVFLIRPYHKLIYRSIKKSPKLYFYDTGYVKGDEGIKLENTCAVNLIKHVQYLYDVKGTDIELNYIRTKEKKEIDFVIVKEGKPETFLEVKLSHFKQNSNLFYFSEKFPDTLKIQLVHNLRTEFDNKGIKFRKAGEWLKGLSA